jgi:hypothetical protein
MKKCNQKIKATCGVTNFATCIYYENTINTDSELDDNTCLTIEETTQDIYNQLENLDLSALGELCLEYVQDSGKNIVKNVLLKFEEKICEYEERITELENRPLCEMFLGDCVDTKCLVDACNENISTVGQLLQALVDLNCETP